MSTRKIKIITLGISVISVLTGWMILLSRATTKAVSNVLGTKIESCNFFPIPTSKHVTMYNCQIDGYTDKINKIDTEFSSFLIWPRTIKKLSFFDVNVKLHNGLFYIGSTPVYSLFEDTHPQTEQVSIHNAVLLDDDNNIISPTCNLKINNHELKLFKEHQLQSIIRRHGTHHLEIKIFDDQCNEIIYKLLDSVMELEKTKYLKRLISNLTTQKKLVVINILTVDGKCVISLRTDIENTLLPIPIHKNKTNINVKTGYINYSIFNAEEIYIKGILSPSADFSYLKRGNYVYGYYKGLDPLKDIGFVIPGNPSFITVDKISDCEMIWTTDFENLQNVNVKFCKLKCDGTITMQNCGVLKFKNGKIGYLNQVPTIDATGMMNVFGNSVLATVKTTKNHSHWTFTMPIHHEYQKEIEITGTVDVEATYSGQDFMESTIDLSKLNAVQNQYLLKSGICEIKQINNSFLIKAKIFDVYFDISIQDGHIFSGFLEYDNNKYDISYDNEVILSGEKYSEHIINMLFYIFNWISSIYPISEMYIRLKVDSEQFNTLYKFSSNEKTIISNDYNK